MDNPLVVDEYLSKEVDLGRVVGPLDPTAFPEVVTNRFGVIPKKHQPGKWRLIVDLSHPKNHSVNDGIEPELCSLSYTSVDEAVRRVVKEGCRTVMAKFDIESAYRLVPVHPEDRRLLGMSWRDQLFIDTALPFGLRSSPKIFTAIADALEWVMQQEGVRSALHYLDDFMVFGKPGSGECQEALTLSLEIFRRLGVPVAKQKTEGPATTLTFLGIELDSEAMEVRLPREKLERLGREIGEWERKKYCTKRELLSLIGQLQHACCVVRAGRSFLRRMIELSTKVEKLSHRITLNKGFQSDLQWWAAFLHSWNGTSMMHGVVQSTPMGTITSDASGSWGCGAFSSSGEWFQLQWPASWSRVHITVKELLPVVVGIALWGQQWRGSTVQCLCDNAAVVAILRSGRSRDRRVMHLMRSLFFFTAHHNIVLASRHIPGQNNGAADALSRNNSASFFTQVPGAARHPTRIDPELRQMLVSRQPDWTSQTWMNLLQSFLQRV